MFKAQTADKKRFFCYDPTHGRNTHISTVLQTSVPINAHIRTFNRMNGELN